MRVPPPLSCFPTTLASGAVAAAVSAASSDLRLLPSDLLFPRRRPSAPQKSVVRSHWPVIRAKAQHAFTLLELLIVIGIIAVLLVLLAPAFTTIKSGSDVTSAAYTIKGALDTARTYAKANNTYTWVGFCWLKSDRIHRRRPSPGKSKSRSSLQGWHKSLERQQCSPSCQPYYRLEK